MVPSFRVVTAWAGEEVNKRPPTNHRQTRTIPNPFFIIPLLFVMVLKENAFFNLSGT
jgi:hypothetical protein